MWRLRSYLADQSDGLCRLAESAHHSSHRAEIRDIQPPDWCGSLCHTDLCQRGSSLLQMQEESWLPRFRRRKLLSDRRFDGRAQSCEWLSDASDPFWGFPVDLSHQTAVFAISFTGIVTNSICHKIWTSTTQGEERTRLRCVVRGTRRNQ